MSAQAAEPNPPEIAIFKSESVTTEEGECGERLHGWSLPSADLGLRSPRRKRAALRCAVNRRKSTEFLVPASAT